MRTRLALASLFLAISTGAPAGANSILDYGSHMADAHVPMDDSFFNVWVNRRRDTLLIEPSMKTALAGAAHFPDLTWRIVSEAFVAPIDCTITDIRPLSRIGAAWEATFACPEGVDLHALVKAQRSDLVKGVRLHR